MSEDLKEKAIGYLKSHYGEDTVSMDVLDSSVDGGNGVLQRRLHRQHRGAGVGLDEVVHLSGRGRCQHGLENEVGTAPRHPRLQGRKTERGCYERHLGEAGYTVGSHR
jgi:hypothetical protein